MGESSHGRFELLGRLDAFAERLFTEGNPVGGSSHGTSELAERRFGAFHPVGESSDGKKQLAERLS
jgi:hypothetical protein